MLPEVQALAVARLLPPRLVALLRNPSATVQECAVGILRVLADSEAHRLVIVNLGLTEEMFRFIQYCNVPARDHAGVIVMHSSFRRAAGSEDAEKRLLHAALPDGLDDPLTTISIPGTPTSGGASFYQRQDGDGGTPAASSRRGSGTPMASSMRKSSMLPRSASGVSLGMLDGGSQQSSPDGADRDSPSSRSRPGSASGKSVRIVDPSQSTARTRTVSTSSPLNRVAKASTGSLPPVKSPLTRGAGSALDDLQ